MAQESRQRAQVLEEPRKRQADGRPEGLALKPTLRITLGLPEGKGPIKKSELGKIRRIGPVKIYSKTQKESFFNNCDPYEELRFKTLYEPAFRKKELVHLEKEDVLKDRQMLRVQSKTRYDENGNLPYKFKAKAISEREVPISKELIDGIAKIRDGHEFLVRTKITGCECDHVRTIRFSCIARRHCFS